MSGKNKKIAIVGGGVAGTSTALYFGGLGSSDGFGGLEVSLFEKESSLISGPPWCHLHAGGNLYREISDEQCVTLLRQSIDFLRFYPFVVDYRPTVIALPISDKSTPSALIPRLELLVHEYMSLIATDKANEVLGSPSEYYQLYSKEKMLELRGMDYASQPSTLEEWMIPVAKNIDFDMVQFPLIIVQEYGLNLFRFSAGATTVLENLKPITLNTNSIVYDIKQIDSNNGWIVSYIKDEVSHSEKFDYLINAAGFRTGKIDDLLGTPCKSMVEFKAAYVSQWGKCGDVKFPEIIFHGERGTPRGMGQFTPYPDGYFQLHGMTNDITLYDDGLVASTNLSCQPYLGEKFIKKIEGSWSPAEIEKRTLSAINHIAQYIPTFANATVGSKPLFGAQQIKGDDPTLRVAEVSFPRKYYARCEIVKVSSVLDMIDAIAQDFIELEYLDKSLLGKRNFQSLLSIDESIIARDAEQVAISRDYPASLSCRSVAKR